MWENTIVIYGVLKKKNYKAKFLNNSILKNKIDKNIFIKKLKQKNKKNPKNNKKILQQSTVTCEKSYTPTRFKILLNL